MSVIDYESIRIREKHLAKEDANVKCLAFVAEVVQRAESMRSDGQMAAETVAVQTYSRRIGGKLEYCYAKAFSPPKQGKPKKKQEKKNPNRKTL